LALNRVQAVAVARLTEPQPKLETEEMVGRPVVAAAVVEEA
jgi:hypothetical protein